MAAEVASAFVSLVPTMKRSDVKKAMMGAGIAGQMGGEGEAASKSFGSKFGKRFKGAMSTGLKAGGLAAGAVAAGALTKGFGRLKSLDDAQGKLAGLGHSAKSIDKIMDNSLNAVKGTAFGLDEAASTAAGAVAAGIKPGSELESTLALVGDAATIAGTDMGSMGAIFNKVAASGKLQGDEIMQLGEAGIPILQFLSKELGVSADEVRKMASAGEIDFATFRDAMEGGLGGAAQESGKTFTGAFKNMNAALGRLGASLLSGIFPQMRNGFGAVTGALDAMGPAAERAGAVIGKGLGGAAKAVGSFVSDFRKGEGAAGKFRDVLSGLWKSLSGAASSAFQALLPHLKTFASRMAALWPQVKSLASAVGGFLMAAFRAAKPYLVTFAQIVGAVLVGALKVLPPVLSVVMTNIRGVLGVMKPLLPVIAGAAAAFALYRGVMFAAGVASKAYAAITTAVKAAQTALNAAMRANPIGLVITAIMLLVGALVYLYKNNETARKIMDAAWKGIKKAISAVVSWFTKTAWPNLKAVFKAIVGAVKKIPGAFKSAGGGIKKAWDKVKGWVMAPIRVSVSWVRKTVAKVPGFFTAARAVIRKVWNKVKAIIMAPVRLAAGWIRKSVSGWVRFFTLARAAIRKAWNKALEILKKPVRLAAKWIRKSVSGWVRFFTAARTAIRKVWNKAQEILKKPVRLAIKWIRRSLAGWYKFFQNARAAIKRVWDKAKEILKKPVRLAVAWIRKHLDRIRAGVVSMRDKVRKAWNKVQEILKRPVRGAYKWIRTTLDKVKDKFKDARDGITRVWKRLQGKLKAPIRASVTWINDKFIGTKDGKGGVNSLLKKVGADFRVNPIPGFARGGYTGPGGKYQYAGDVHAGEFVLRKKATNRLKQEIGLDALNHMNRTGRLPLGGYASGGLVERPGYAKGGMVYQDMARWFRKNFPNKQITSAYRPGSRTAASNSLSYHARGKALDMSPSMSIFNKIKSTFGSAIRELIYSPAGGRQVHNGKNHRYSGITRAMHWDHVHWAMNSMKKGSLTGLLGGLSSGGSFLDDLTDVLKKPALKLLDKFKGKGAVGAMVPAILKKAIDGMVGKAESRMDIGGVLDTFNTAHTAGVKKQVQATARGYGWGSGNQWDALKWIIGKESSWNPKAANPTSSARGLFQKMTNIHGPVEKTISGQTRWGLNYIKNRYGSPTKAKAFWRRNNWYADGGEVAPKPLLFDKGGYLPEGLNLVQNNTGAPEPLMRMNGGGGMTFNLIDADGVLIGTMRGVAADEAAYASTIGRQQR